MRGNGIYEIRIMIKETVEFRKRIFSKGKAVKLFQQIPKAFNKIKFPEIFLIQNDFNNKNIQTSSVILLKNRININKMNLEQVKNLLEL